MIKFINIIISFVILNVVSIFCLDEANDSLSFKSYFFPKTDNKWEFRGNWELSVADLPRVVVEEEVSHSPMLGAALKVKSPYNISSALSFQSNYICNYGQLDLKYHLLNSDFSLALGSKIAVWFGHIELDAIRLKSMGWILYPTVTLGYDFKKFLLSAELETQHSDLYTYSEDQLLGVIWEPRAGYAAKFTVEQPFSGTSVVALSVKLNYSKFYYQSWLSYNTISDYLIYPEFIFSYIL